MWRPPPPLAKLDENVYHINFVYEMSNLWHKYIFGHFRYHKSIDILPPWCNSFQKWNYVILKIQKWSYIHMIFWFFFFKNKKSKSSCAKLKITNSILNILNSINREISHSSISRYQFFCVILSRSKVTSIWKSCITRDTWHFWLIF